MDKSFSAANQEQMRFDSLYAQLNENNSFFYIGDLARRAAVRWPDQCALICQDIQLTYKELFARIQALTELLLEYGIKRGNRVVVWLDNSCEFYIAYFAVLQTGAVVVPLNVFLTSSELTHILTDAHPSFIITDTQKASLLPTSSHLIITTDDFPMHPRYEHNGNSFTGHPDELSVLLYTSGTTGLPKGVMLSSRNCMTNMIQALARIIPHERQGQQERLIAPLPLFHSFAQSTCVWMALWMGCTVIIVPKIERRTLIQALQHHPTIFIGVPALYGLLCLMKTAHLASIHYFVCGGDALSDKIRSAFALLYRRTICNGYGLTEASPLVSVYFNEKIVAAGVVGIPFCGIKYELRDDDGKRIEPPAVGQLWIKGDNVMLGYYNAPEATAHVLQNGWLCTGDLACHDHEQNLIIVGRQKDLIVHKGIKIYPQEVEAVLMKHPSVINAAVIGQVDAATGEIPVAYVQVYKEANNDIERLLHEWCTTHLASYKVPRQYHCSFTALPMTSTGKIDKKILKKQLHNGQS